MQVGAVLGVELRGRGVIPERDRPDAVCREFSSARRFLRRVRGRPGDAILDRRGLPAFTPNTITDRDALYAELHRVRRDGVAYDREEIVEGLRCVAAPILDVDGSVCAAMSIAAPAERFAASETAYRSAVVRSARAVTERLRRQMEPENPE